MSNNLILVILVVLVFMYSFFSASETAFSSLNRVKLKALANQGNKRAEETIKLDEKFSKLLTTILIGNTIVNVVSASLATVFFTNIYKNNGVAISSVVMTIVIMVIGEIIPKNLAKRKPEKFAMAVTPFLNFLVFIFTPLTAVFNGLEKLIFKNSDDDDSYSTEEIKTIVEEANEDGDIEDHEADLITNALEFNDLDVGEILTPRIDVVAVDIDEDSFDDIEKKYRESGYSRLPVFKESIDNIIGVLIEKDFYHLYYTNKGGSIDKIIKNVVYTSPQVKISHVLRQLQSNKTHMAIVVDEYGGTEGIITMEDILEELVGEIYDEHDKVIEYYKKIDDNTYLIKGDLDIEDMFERLDVKCDEEFDYNTTSAWVIDQMDKIPEKGEKFKYKNLNVEIVDADSKVVNLIKVTLDKNDSKRED